MSHDDYDHPILIMGCNGQVGWQLQRTLAPLGKLVMADVDECDITDADAIGRLIERVDPSVIVNAAAHTAVDRAESESMLAFRINADAVASLAEQAKKRNALLIHYSTDYVFDGSGTAPWSETSQTGPLNVYGASKLAGEEAMRLSGCRGFIFRTSWVFDRRGANFVKTLLRLANERETLNVVNDQIGHPTPAALIADVTALILAQCRRVEEPGLVQTYHLVADGAVSWYEFARTIVLEAGSMPGFTLKLKADAIMPIPSSAYPLPARRPPNSRMDCGKLENTFGLRMPHWLPYLRRILAEMAPG